MRAARLILLVALLVAACDLTEPDVPGTVIAPRGPTLTTAPAAKGTIAPATPTLAPTATSAISTPVPATSAAPGRTIVPALPPGSIGWRPTSLRGVALNAVAASADGALFYAAGAAGIWRSTDFGASWTQQAAQFPIAALTLDPDAPDTIYAAEATNCSGPGALHASSDGGASWRTLLPGAGAPVVTGNQLVAASCAGTQLSDDAGASWRVVDARPGGAAPIGFAIAAAANALYAAYYGATSIVIRHSADNGASWQNIGAPAAFQPSATGNDALAVLPGESGTLFIATAGGLLRSADNGTTWEAVGGKLDAAVTALLSVPNGRGAVYAAVLGRGVFRSTNGHSWTTVAGEPSAGQISSLAYVASAQAGDTLTPPILLAATGDGVWRVSLAAAR